MIDAQEAYRIGLVNEIAPAANLIARAEAILNRIDANAPVAVKLAIDAANRGLDVSLAEGLAIEASHLAECVATADMKEGVAAFREKRKPQFQGR
jgi:enoyl-CoA hydratase